MDKGGERKGMETWGDGWGCLSYTYAVIRAFWLHSPLVGHFEGG